jgi:NADH:ubiquinone reductase (H+-translocating)
MELTSLTLDTAPLGTARTHVVVVGGGFGGVAAARRLARADVDVTLVDRHPYNTFKPLLYQVATAGLNAGDITWFLRAERAANPRFRFVLGSVTAVDTSARRVELDGGRRLDYDHLVLATGVVVEWYAVPGAARHALPLYGRAEALALRDRLFAGLETLSRGDPGREVRVVVVGGGATGVETVGALAEMRNRDLRVTYPELASSRVHLTLVERGPDLLAPFHPRMRAYAARALLRRGVDLRLGTTVAAVEADGVVLRRPHGATERLAADLVVWASGVRVPDAVRAWGLPLGDRGRIAVDAHCRVVGVERVYAIGDVAAHADAPLPQVATPALQQGRYVGRLIARTERQRATRPFRYRDKGTMAVIGRASAVAEIRYLPRLTGLPAWLAWLGLHVLMLLGRRNRVATTVNLAARYLAGSRNVIVGDGVPTEASLAPPRELTGG